MNQILIHNGNNNYKLPHIGKLKIEKAVGSNISMRLPCWALIDGGALNCQYITTFMSNPTVSLSLCSPPAVVAVVVCRRPSHRRHRRRRTPLPLLSSSSSSVVPWSSINLTPYSF